MATECQTQRLQDQVAELQERLAATQRDNARLAKDNADWSAAWAKELTAIEAGKKPFLSTQMVADNHSLKATVAELEEENARLREACVRMLHLIDKHYPNDWQGTKAMAQAALGGSR